MNPTQKREKFRAILSGDRCIHPASVFDPISVRIAEDLGFELAFMAGSMASVTQCLIARPCFFGGKIPNAAFYIKSESSEAIAKTHALLSEIVISMDDLIRITS